MLILDDEVKSSSLNTEKRSILILFLGRCVIYCNPFRKFPVHYFQWQVDENDHFSAL